MSSALSYTRLPHYGALIESGRTRILVDPLFTEDWVWGSSYVGANLSKQAFDPDTEIFDAIVLTRQIEPHFHLPTLHRLKSGMKKKTPVFFPDGELRIQEFLSFLGFESATSLRRGQTTQIGDLRLLPLPSWEPNPCINLSVGDATHTLGLFYNSPQAVRPLSEVETFGPLDLFIDASWRLDYRCIPFIQGDPKRFLDDIGVRNARLRSRVNARASYCVPYELRHPLNPWVEEFHSKARALQTDRTFLRVGEMISCAHPDQVTRRWPHINPAPPRSNMTAEVLDAGILSRIQNLLVDRAVREDGLYPHWDYYKSQGLKWELRILDDSAPASHFVDFMALRDHGDRSAVDPSRPADVRTSVHAVWLARYFLGEISLEALWQGGFLQVETVNLSPELHSRITVWDPLAAAARIRFLNLANSLCLKKLGCLPPYEQDGVSPWVPIDIWGPSDDLNVDFIYRRNWSFDEPFFHETVRHRSPHTARITMKLSELIANQRGRSDCIPAGFFYHVTRCGSTLTCQMLSSIPEAVVLKEPSFLETIFYSAAFSVARKTLVLITILNAMNRALLPTEKGIIIKFAGAIDWLPWIHEVYPKTPWVFQYRHPEEVLRSNIERPTLQFQQIEDPIQRQEALSRKYEMQVKSVLGHARDAALLVNYSAIDEEYPRRLLRAFRVPESPELIEKMRSSSQWYSKRNGLRWEKVKKIEDSSRVDALPQPVGQYSLDLYAEISQLGWGGHDVG